jgi:hypothetical protein
MKLHDAVAYAIILGALYASQKLDRDPFFFALHKGRHDLVDTLFIQTPWLNVIDILFVVFPCLFLPRAPRHSSVPGFGIFNAKRFNDGVGELRTSLCLGLAADVARAIRFGTIARLWISAVTVDVVVENQLFSGLNSSLGENAHSQSISDYPFVHIAIGIAGVVAKATEITSLRSIDKLALRQRHEVEMLDALFVVLLHSSSKDVFADHFTNIFENEIVRPEISVGTKPESLLLRFDDRNVSILFALETPILTTSTARTVANTLHLGGTIDAV